MSQKVLDPKGRWRNVKVGFRMSVQEAEELNERVRICGKKKQDYLIKSALHQRLVVVGNKQVFAECMGKLKSIESELKRLESVREMDEELLTPLRTILEILQGFDKK